MPLTDIRVRTAKPKEKDYKLADGAGLYLFVKANGSKYWRMKYRRPNGKEGILAFGVYPDTSLADAREYRTEARRLKAKGIDPGEFKREQKAIAAENVQNTVGCNENGRRKS